MLNRQEIKKLSKSKLLAEYNIMSQQIEICFGVKDLLYLDMLEAEIARRGYELQKQVNFRFA